MIILNQYLGIKSKHFMTIIHCLQEYGGQSRLIGGVVRDSLLGKDASDVDIATNLLPQQVINILTLHNIMVIPTGIKFGTVTAIIKNESFEITTLREDIDSNGRHPCVKYSNNFRQDAERRDFTINALSYCPIKGRIYDYFGGLKDLEKRKVIFIGNAVTVVQEDYLRILRFFRFSTRYADTIDVDGLNICTYFKSHLKKLSQERIKSEIDRLLVDENSPGTLQVMYDNGILQSVLPISEYDQRLHFKALSICKIFNTTISLPIIYFILFMFTKDTNFYQLVTPYIAKHHANIIIKIRSFITIEDNDSVILFLKNLWLQQDKNFLEYCVIFSLLVTDNKYIHDLYLELQNKNIPVFPITGHDIIILGYRGKNIGRVLDYLKTQWVSSDFQATKSCLLNMVLVNENQ